MKEIERKFLVNQEKWIPPEKKICIKQGYLSTHPGRIVRIRIAGDKAWLTLKSDLSGFTRNEFEYPVTVTDACLIMKMSPFFIVEKYRHLTEYRGLVWEVDEFTGENQGLWIAEVELETEDQPVEYPEWIGEEVTSDPRYYNAYLAEKPFSTWPADRLTPGLSDR